jgi:hypothetical protein
MLRVGLIDEIRLDADPEFLAHTLLGSFDGEDVWRSPTVVPAARSTTTSAGAVDADPRFNVRKHPDLALGQLGDRLGKIGPRGELVNPLAGHAEHVADLVRSHEGKRPILHAYDYRRRTR